METADYDELEKALKHQGPEAAIDLLCRALRDKKDYGALFYALLLKKRYELGVTPVPTEAAQDLPESAQGPYEDTIREAGRLVGSLYLEEGDIARAFMYYRLLGELEPVVKALEKHQVRDGEDVQPLIEIAFHHGVHPRKGFDWVLERNGICSAITLASGHEFPQPDVREYCIKALVRALYDQLSQRLRDEITQHEGTP